MLRLAEGVHTPIALHCSGFIFNVGKSGRNRQNLTEHSVKVSPFLFPSTITESNLIYSECVNLFLFFFFCTYLSRILWFSRTVFSRPVFKDLDGRFDPSSIALTKRFPNVNVFLAF